MRRLLLAAMIAALAVPALAPAQEPSFGAGAYLFHYRPFGDQAPEPVTELYAAFATADVTAPRWRIHAELRARDTKLRAFFPGNVWLQQGWASYDVVPGPSAPSLTLRAGKIYQTLGRFWDGSFFGNVHYFDGLKLNPQFGLEAAGTLALGRLALGYTGQLVMDSDRISGALPGRDFETLDGLRNRDGGFGRLTLGLPFGLTVGASAASRGVAQTTDATEAVHRVPHYGADLELEWRGLLGYVEWLERRGGELPAGLRGTQAGSEARYWLAGLQGRRGKLHARYNFSRAAYDAIDRDEWIHQPGLGYDLTPGLHGLAEVNLWEFEEPGSRGRVDRSLNVVLLLRF